MKKILTLITSLFLLASLPTEAQETTGSEVITLSHNGQESTFAYNEMSKVMEQAADGDTVYFSTGYFQGDFRLDKKLTFIGAGADNNSSNGSRWGNCTCYYGKIVIALPEGTKLTSRLFDGIYFYSNGTSSCLTFSNAIENVVFRKCYLGNWDVNAEIKSLLIDRCAGPLRLNNNNYYKKVIVRNSDIYGNFYCQDPGNLLFYHCNINPYTSYDDDNRDKTYCYGLQGTYTNCIIQNNTSYWDNSTQTSIYTAALLSRTESTQDSQPILINCAYYTEDGKNITANCTLQNCFGYPISNEKSLGNLSKAELEAAGYMGNDGTVVGYYGGKNPYTLQPSIPKVASSKIHLDRDAKQLQINIKVSAQQ